jgi:hypothetical protein
MGVSVGVGPGRERPVVRPADRHVTAEPRTPPAERPPTGETELARGRVEQTPASLISWVALAIAVPAALVVLVALLVYVLT